MAVQRVVKLRQPVCAVRQGRAWHGYVCSEQRIAQHDRGVVASNAYAETRKRAEVQWFAAGPASGPQFGADRFCRAAGRRNEAGDSAHDSASARSEGGKLPGRDCQLAWLRAYPAWRHQRRCRNNETQCDEVPKFAECVRQPCGRLPGRWAKRFGTGKCQESSGTAGEQYDRVRSAPKRYPAKRRAKTKTTRYAPAIGPDSGPACFHCVQSLK